MANADRDRSLRLMREIAAAQLRAGEAWIRERDVSIEQAFLIGYLVENPGVIQRDIARSLNRGEANISSMLSKLEARGLVQREAEHGNARIKRVSATEAGQAVIAGLDHAMAETDQKILSAASADERRMLTEVLDKIATHIDLHTDF